MNIKNAVLVLMVLLPTVSFANSDVLRMAGIQYIEGETAVAIYNSIPGDEIPGHVITVPGKKISSEQNDKPFYTKEVAELTCFGDLNGNANCWVQTVNHKQSRIEGKRISRKIFNDLISSALPMGLNLKGEGTLTGYVKNVAGITCNRNFESTEYSCNIRFRQ